MIAMRYWHPMTDEAVDSTDEAGVEDVVLLPLYPHYSKTTTGSSVREWERELARERAHTFRRPDRRGDTASIRSISPRS